LRRSIDTILAQTFEDFELILLDDSSTDDSRSILDEYARDARVRIEFNELNSGSTFKPNFALDLAKTRIVHEHMRRIAFISTNYHVPWGGSESSAYCQVAAEQ
jgi:glycosyltransferase involved in cell wall biosynthesis